MHRHARFGGSSRIGDRLTPEVVPFIADPNPIHRAQNNRIPSSRQDNATRRQRHANGLASIVSKWATNRRRDIGLEYADTHIGDTDHRQAEESYC
ncbi:hypothetical protein OAH23_01595 [Verrucomicrobia bacterium]|nr:hypothetical protein [Verrucomicrobiota bacterium]